MQDQGLWLCFRNYMGEDLDGLSLKELQNLEQQLDSSLKHIRSRKVNEKLCYLESILFFY
jgi:hypothetical protein